MSVPRSLSLNCSLQAKSFGSRGWTTHYFLRDDLCLTPLGLSSRAFTSSQLMAACKSLVASSSSTGLGLLESAALSCACILEGVSESVYPMIATVEFKRRCTEAGRSFFLPLLAPSCMPPTSHETTTSRTLCTTRGHHSWCPRNIDGTNARTVS